MKAELLYGIFYKSKKVKKYEKKSLHQSFATSPIDNGLSRLPGKDTTPKVQRLVYCS
jgi:hypothetical protein